MWTCDWSVEVSAGLSRLELPGQLQAIPGNAGGEQVVSTLPQGRVGTSADDPLVCGPLWGLASELLVLGECSQTPMSGLLRTLHGRLGPPSWKASHPLFLSPTPNLHWKSWAILHLAMSPQHPTLSKLFNGAHAQWDSTFLTEHLRRAASAVQSGNKLTADKNSTLQ